MDGYLIFLKKQTQDIKKKDAKSVFFGAGNQIRTDDLFITSEPLYRLSHTSVFNILTVFNRIVQRIYVCCVKISVNT